MTDMTLLDRLKELKGPSRKVDALVEVEARRQQAYLVGVGDSQRSYWVPVGDKGEVHDEQGYSRYHSPEYTRSLDAAVALVEKLLPGWDWWVSFDRDYGNLAYVYRKQTEGDPHIGSTPAIALLIALLTALEHEGGQSND